MTSRTIYLVPARTVSSSRNIVVTPQRSVVPLTRHNVCNPTVSSVRTVTQTSLKRSAPVSVDPIEELLNDSTGSAGPRKRERLNHLSQEEKMNRRKLKNRVAAQTARDRKKVRSQKLEDVVRQLLAENQKLRDENKRLREEKKHARDLSFESAEGTGNVSHVSDPSLPDDLIPEEELARIIEDLKEDFDIDQLSSELPSEDYQWPEAIVSSPISECSVYSSCEASSSVEQSFLTTACVPSSPSSSVSFTSQSSPVSSESPVWQSEEKKLNDPLLSDYPPEQQSYLSQDTLWPSNNQSPFNDTFAEEFFQLY